MTPPLKKFSNIFHEILNNQKPYSFVTCAQYLCLFNSVGAYPPILLRVNSKFTDIMYQVHCTLSAQLLLVIITELCSVCLCLSVPPWEDPHNRVQTIVQTRQYITQHTAFCLTQMRQIFHGRAVQGNSECLCRVLKTTLFSYHLSQYFDFSSPLPAYQCLTASEHCLNLISKT